MSTSDDIAEFLTSRRARITPEQADLARAANPTVATQRRPVGRRVRPAVQRILDAMGTPALLRNARVDYLAANQLGYALYAPLFESAEQPANSARFTFLDPAAVDFYAEWERVADDLVAHLRSEAGRHPHDRGLSDLVGQLSTRSAEFRTRWAAHNIRFHQTGTKRFHHPVVGELSLSYETMELSADSGLSMTVYTAEAGSASQAALDILASWARRSTRRTPLASGTKPTAADTAPAAGRRGSHVTTISQESQIRMEITRSSIDTAKGPADWFTGDVYIDAVAASPAPARVQANLVHFTPGARTAWHTHPLGQTIYVTEGVGLCQRRGGPIGVIRPGDRVFFEPDEDHWHGAAPNRFMVHLALNEVDDDHVAVHWGEKVTDDEYAAAPATDN